MVKNKRTKGNKCIYTHTRIDTGDVFYIGIGYYSRPYETRNRNKFWNNIVNKSEYKISILYKNLSKKQACNLEIYLISIYGRRDLKTGTLVNLTNGGDGILGNKRSKETCEKISRGRIGIKFTEEHKKNLSKFNLGKKLSEETKLKISIGTSGVKNNMSKKIINIITSEVFDSATEVANKINMNISTFYNQLNCRNKHKTDYRWLL